MKMVTCILLLLLATIVSSWDPVRPGALVRKTGKVFIVNESVRVILKLDNVTHMDESLGNVRKGLDTVKMIISQNGIKDNRLEKKMSLINEKVSELESNFKQTSSKETRNKRAAPMVLAIAGIAGLGLTNMGFHVNMYSRMNTLERAYDKIEQLFDTTEDITDSVNDIIENLEQIDNKTTIVRVTLDTFMLLDQIYIKVYELHSNVEQLIQDLVLANTGSVTSTLLSITKLMNIVTTAKNNWNFQPFFEMNSIALYYPLLNSYLNGTSVIIDIPFSSELKFNLYKIIPFPVNLNGSILEVDIQQIDPINYVLSLDRLKESQITNDELTTCKKTDIDLYLCLPIHFTLNEALDESCPASLVNNVSIFKNCHFKEIQPIIKHETVQEAHYIYFPRPTTVSIVCQDSIQKSAIVNGSYSVPDSCELHSMNISTIANGKKTIELEKEKLLIDLKLSLPKESPTLKIKRLKKKTYRNIFANQFLEKPVYYMTIPIIIVFLILIIIIFCLFKKIKRMPRKMIHVASSKP